MLVRHTESLTVHLSLLIHVDRLFGLLCVDVALFGLLVVVAIKLKLRLVEEHFVHGLRVVLSCDLQGRVPVLFVLVHVDSFLGLVSLDELLLSFFESALILQVKSVLEVNLGKLVLSVVVCKPESFVKFLLVCFEINSCLDETVFDQELDRWPTN